MRRCLYCHGHDDGGRCFAGCWWVAPGICSTCADDPDVHEKASGLHRELVRVYLSGPLNQGVPLKKREHEYPSLTLAEIAAHPRLGEVLLRVDDELSIEVMRAVDDSEIPVHIEKSSRIEGPRKWQDDSRQTVSFRFTIRRYAPEADRPAKVVKKRVAPALRKRPAPKPRALHPTPIPAKAAKPARVYAGPKPVEIEVEGTRFPTLRQAATAYGIGYPIGKVALVRALTKQGKIAKIVGA